MEQESAKVRELRTAYQASLENKADELGQLTESELPEFLHRLAGSAGMYGYAAIAEAARELLQFYESQELQPQNDTFPDGGSNTAKQNLIRLLRDA